MGRVIILEETTKKPLTLMGQRAGVCWGGDITDNNKNYKRGLNCLESGHGRVLEYVNVEMILEGYSARVIREWYTHIGGSPTRLQASTRYINYQNFDYVIPHSISNNKIALEKYKNVMQYISDECQFLTDVCNIPKEDVALILPLGMETVIVDKRNLRNLIDMSHQRMCLRANWEYRNLFSDICNELTKISNEWTFIVKNYFAPKCKSLGYCPEKNGCGMKPNKKEI